MRRLALAVLLLACACGREPAQPVASPQATAPATPCVPSSRTGGDKNAAMFLQDVRVAAQPDADRIVFEFMPREGQAPLTPYYEIGPTTPPLLEDASGKELAVDGTSFMKAVIWASGVDLSEQGARLTYTGPKSIKPPDTKVVRELREGGDFENVLTWYAGLRSDACFTVKEFTDPVRIVVDIQT